MCSGVGDWALLSPSRVSPFGNPRITVRLPTPRGLSQVPTSFIGSWCQGIHRVPLLTWPQRCSRPLCSSQGTGGPEHLVRACSCGFLRSASSWAAAAAVRGGVGPRPTARWMTERPAVRCGLCPFPQDPTACRRRRTWLPLLFHPLPVARRRSTEHGREARRQIIDVPPLSSPFGSFVRSGAWTPREAPDAP
jgi:hypothetical protein